MEVFELPEVAEILGLDLAKAKNWSNGRTGLVIEPSVRKATGTGSRNLFSLNDLYLFGIAQACSKTGFAAAAIGKLVDSLRPKYPDLSRVPILTLWRPKAGERFEITESSKDPDASIWVRLDVPRVCKDINYRIKKRGPKGAPKQ